MRSDSARDAMDKARRGISHMEYHEGAEALNQAHAAEARVYLVEALVHTLHRFILVAALATVTLVLTLLLIAWGIP